MRAARYRIEVADDLDWDEAVDRYLAAPEAIVVRTAPNKADRRIDVRAFCGTLERTPDGLIAEIQMTEAGTARPDEVATAVAAAIGATPTITRLVRTETLLHDTPAGALT